MIIKIKKAFFNIFIRKPIGFLIAIPFWILIRVTTPITGREKAISIWGPLVRSTVTLMAEILLIPKTEGAEDFDEFCRKMKRNIAFLSPIYDVSVVRHDENALELNYYNCPHCEAFFLLGLRELGPFCCESDWLIACKHEKKWDFQRENQIGTGDRVCNHTYKRKT